MAFSTPLAGINNTVQFYTSIHLVLTPPNTPCQITAMLSISYSHPFNTICLSLESFKLGISLLIWKINNSISLSMPWGKLFKKLSTPIPLDWKDYSFSTPNQIINLVKDWRNYSKLIIIMSNLIILCKNKFHYSVNIFQMNKGNLSMEEIFQIWMSFGQYL